MSDPYPELEPCLAGSALGLFAGDALGAPVEGLPHAAIARRVGWVSAMLGGRFAAGAYTDDTQLMIGILETLADDDTLPPEKLAAAYARNYQPHRGYGASTGEVLRRHRAGEIPFTALSRDSFGNGGAMGIAPLGVYFCTDLQAVAARAGQACRVTHHHLEAVSGAIAVALAAALMARARLAGETPEGPRLLHRLREAPALAASPIAGPLERLAALPWRGPPAERAAWLAGHFGCTLRAVESVPVALGAALAAGSLREAVEVGVNAGGDTDTQGAMAGGIAGAFHGEEGLPPDWREAMENGPRGRDHVRALARRLARG